jgi:hypothetical protein
MKEPRGPKTKHNKPSWVKASKPPMRIIDGGDMAAPSWLTNEYSIERYHKLVNMYGHAVESDNLALAAAHYGRSIEAEKSLNEQGDMFEDARGSVKKSPAAQIMKDNSKAYLDFVKVFDALLEKNPKSKGEEKPEGAAAYEGGARG